MSIDELISQIQAQGCHVAPGMSSAELKELGNRFPNGLPSEIQELLLLTTGVEIPGTNTLVDFTGRMYNPDSYRLEGTPPDIRIGYYYDVFPYRVELLHADNKIWVIDVNSDTGNWGCVFLLTHDPNEVILVARNLVDFLDKYIVRNQSQNSRSVISEEGMKIGGVTQEQALKGVDIQMRDFAVHLNSNWTIFDLREVNVEAGFEEATGKLARYKNELLFACEQKRYSTLWDRLFRKAQN